MPLGETAVFLESQQFVFGNQSVTNRQANDVQDYKLRRRMKQVTGSEFSFKNMPNLDSVQELD